MRKIKLTRGQYAIIDDADYDLISQFNWHCSAKGYAERSAHNGETRKMHRVIMNAPDGMQVDHINRNKLDNRRSNLRLCTNTQNVANTPPRPGRKYKGISFIESTNRWKAEIYTLGKSRYLGVFNCPKKAALAYNKAAVQKYGSFAYLNQVQA